MNRTELGNHHVFGEPCKGLGGVTLFGRHLCEVFGARKYLQNNSERVEILKRHQAILHVLPANWGHLSISHLYFEGFQNDPKAQEDGIAYVEET